MAKLNEIARDVCEAIMLGRGDRYEKPTINASNIERRGEVGIEIAVRQMYDPVEINFDKLKKLSDIFGTDKIDVDDYAAGGCETCDYGSSYGHDIQVIAPTLCTELLDYLTKFGGSDVDLKELANRSDAKCDASL